ncbi:MAG: 30S ribosomal protein S5 [Patescibacteria group bacterium]
MPERDTGFTENVISIDRVARVVKGGRRFRFRALVVVGDKSNKVGIGIAKGADVTTAVSKATDIAKKKLIAISVIDGTLAHEVYAKVGGAKILIKPASPGTGLISGGVVRALLEAVGIKNALSKSLGSNNKINMAYATLEALSSIEPRENWVTTKNSKAKKPVSKEVAEVAEPIVKKPIRQSQGKPVVAKKAKVGIKK